MIYAKDFSRIYAKKFGVTYEYSQAICNSVFGLLGKLLYEEGQDVCIHRFGSFKHKETAPKRARHPGTGEMITIPAKTIIKFKETEVDWNSQDGEEQ